jgi:hypothetical protein
MMKKGYGARKRRDHTKEYVRLCYKCKSSDHIVADCPYNSDNEENEKKKNKKEKENKEKKIAFKKKKKCDSYVVTWDSDASSDDDCSDDDKTSKKKKALASVAINNKASLFDTSSCFMAKGSKVKYDESYDDSECESDNNDDYEFSNEQLMDMLEQAS